ncbi:MAG: DUF4365 domain-containing protein [Alphaproteobacteria bacterium]|nr:DUF4365 domain-containing protein [Alphaproteobacteria bacterium]
MTLSPTQTGVIGENLLVNAIMKASDGRLSPFQPVADDDGLDVLFFDKVTGNSVAIQLKCRTVTKCKPNSDERGNVVDFHVRMATINYARRAYLVAALFNEELTNFVCTWLIPMERLPDIGNKKPDKFVICASKSSDSTDKYTSFRYMTTEELAKRIIAICEIDPAKT